MSTLNLLMRDIYCMQDQNHAIGFCWIGWWGKVRKALSSRANSSGTCCSLQYALSFKRCLSECVLYLLGDSSPFMPTACIIELAMC